MANNWHDIVFAQTLFKTASSLLCSLQAFFKGVDHTEKKIVEADQREPAQPKCNRSLSIGCLTGMLSTRLVEGRSQENQVDDGNDSYV